MTACGLRLPLCVLHAHALGSAQSSTLCLQDTDASMRCAQLKEKPLCMQLCVERIVGAHGMINYVDARTAWMDDIVKQAQWQGITQVGFVPANERAPSEYLSGCAPSLGCSKQCSATAIATARRPPQTPLHDDAKALCMLSALRVTSLHSSVLKILASLSAGSMLGMERGACRRVNTDPVQVVILAAGYDTRCYRLKTGNTQVRLLRLLPKVKSAFPITVKNDIRYHEQISQSQAVLTTSHLLGRDEHCPASLPAPTAA